MRFSKEMLSDIEEYRSKFKGNIIEWVIRMFNDQPSMVWEKYKQFQFIFDHYKDEDGWIEFDKVPKRVYERYMKFYKSYIVPDEQQTVMLNSLLNNPKTSVKSGKGCGKTTVLSWFSMYFCSVYNAEVYITGANFKQLKKTIIKEVKKWRQKSKFLHEYFNTTMESIIPRDEEFAEISYINIISAKDPEGMQGLHSDAIAFLVDEASILTSEYELVINGVMTSNDEDNGRIARVGLSGNPIRIVGSHFDSFHKNVEEYFGITLSSERSLNSHDSFIKGIIKKFGRDSNEFRTQVAGDFPTTSSNTVLSYDLITSLEEIEHDHLFALETTLGIDVSGSGQDSTWIATRFGFVLGKMVKIPSDSTPKMMRKIYAAIDSTPNLIRINVDANGIGYHVYGFIKEYCKKNHKKVKVYPIFNQAKAKDDITYENCGTEQYFYLRELFEQGKIYISRGKLGIPHAVYDLLKEQLSSRESLESGNGRVILEGKDKVKKKFKWSPDLADAVALCYYRPKGAKVILTSFDRNKSYEKSREKLNKKSAINNILGVKKSRKSRSRSGGIRRYSKRWGGR